MCFEGEGDWSLNAFLGIEKPKTQLTYTSKNWNDGKLTYKNWGYKKYNGSLFLCRRKLALLRLGSRRRRLNEAFRLSSKINKLLITHLSLPEIFYFALPPSRYHATSCSNSKSHTYVCTHSEPLFNFQFSSYQIFRN